MIKTLSPHYITTSFVSSLGITCARYKLEIYAWAGDKTVPPDDPNYSITINNPTASTGDSAINIARLLNDFISFVPLDSTGTDLLDSDNQVWVKTQIYYSDTLTGAFYTNPESVNTQLAIRGYAYGNEGANTSVPTNKILMPLVEYNMSVDGKFVIPIELVEGELVPPPTPSITITNVTLDAGDVYDVEFTAVGSYLSFYAIVTPDAPEVPFIDTFLTITSPQQITLPTGYTGDVDVQMFGYDSYYNINVSSNVYNFTIV